MSSRWANASCFLIAFAPTPLTLAVQRVVAWGLLRHMDTVSLKDDGNVDAHLRLLNVDPPIMRTREMANQLQLCHFHRYRAYTARNLQFTAHNLAGVTL